MRRVARHAFTALSALSLLLCVATCALWVRSYLVADLIHLTSQTRWFYVYTCRGTVTAGTWLKVDHDLPFSYRRHRALETEKISWLNPRDEQQTGKVWRFAGFAYLDMRTSNIRSHRKGYAPLWAACVAFAIAPALWGWRRLGRARRLDAGLCSNCGYDLRASPGRCPECGADGPRA